MYFDFTCFMILYVFTGFSVPRMSIFWAISAPTLLCFVHFRFSQRGCLADVSVPRCKFTLFIFHLLVIYEY